MGDPCPAFQASDLRSLKDSGKVEAKLRHRIHYDFQQSAQDEAVWMIMEDCMFLGRMIVELESAREIVNSKLYEIIMSESPPYI